MKKRLFSIVFVIFFVMGSAFKTFALGETGKTVTYKMTHTTSAGELSTYLHYSIVAHEENGYWLQRITSLKPDSAPLSITQTLLDDFTHEAVRYIMHRPAKMDTPENVLDLPLAKMGKDEILPIPGGKPGSESVTIQTDAGSFETKGITVDDTLLWLSLEIPVLGVVKVATKEWTMEVVRISERTEDLLPKKPPQGGIVYLDNE